MKGLTALVLIACAIGAITYFWPQRDPQTVASPASEGPSERPPPAPSGALLQAVPPTSAPSPARVPPSGTIDRPSATAARIVLNAPDTVRYGDTVPVTIDMQALRAMRHLEFSLTYKTSILRLLNSSPGALAQQQGMSVHFDESSDGSDGFVVVRIDAESGVIAGAGSVAVLEFQVRKRGVSPLLVHDMTYVEYGSQDMANVPDAYERSITVD